MTKITNPNLAKTEVHTADGLVTISRLSVGSMVLAYNEATDTVDLYPVTQVHEHLDPVIIILTIDDDLTDDHPGLIIETTPEHPFYVAGTWVNAEDLTVGTVLTSFDGEQGILPRGTITSTVRVEQEQMMYDLTVDTAHTFFVGDGQYLVHNTNPCQRAFAPGQWLNHYQKHMIEFPEFSTAVEYLRGAQNLTNGGPGIHTFTRNNGETLWYRLSTNEFAVLRSDGQTIKTYFKPLDANQYWLNNTGGTGGVPSW